MDIRFSGVDKPAKIVAWKVKIGTIVRIGHIIFEFIEKDGVEPHKRIRFKSDKAGIITQILAANSSDITKGMPLCLLDKCPHPTVMNDMCAECCTDLRKLDDVRASATVSMIHTVPGLKISQEQAQKFGKAEEGRLLKARKLSLLVDLDQTIIHTTNDLVPSNVEDVFHFQLWGHGSHWYHTRIRPFTKQFLENMSKCFELHICSFGSRGYAHTIAHHLDPNEKYFSKRILSRDECFSQNSKTANLKEIFPHGDHMVCIIDDREDVWNYAPNLIHVKPYHFFRHTGDINAPPGLRKDDNDDKTGFDFSKDLELNNKKTTTTISDGGGGVKSVKFIEEEFLDESEKNKKESEKEKEKKSEPKKENIDEKNDKKSIKDIKNDLLISDDDDSDRAEEEEGANEGDKESNEEDETHKKSNNNKSKSETETEEGEIKNNNNKNENEEKDKVNKVNKGDGEEKSSEIVNKEEKKESDSASTSTAEKSVDVDKKVEEKKENESSTQTQIKSSMFSSNSSNNNMIKLEDTDDYLLHLEEILSGIHRAFFELYDEFVKKEQVKIPDVKNVIPYVRRRVLRGVNMVFSGLVPTAEKLESSRPYKVAIALGAIVTPNFIPPNSKEGTPTTHLVAARIGTSKINEARRYKGIHIVTPDWLWCCAERWEKAEEGLYPLLKKSNIRRIPPAHCSSPEQLAKYDDVFTNLSAEGSSTSSEAKDSATSTGPIPSTSKNMPASRKARTPSGRFMDTINPLLSFSTDELEIMGHEVDDICNESNSSSSSEGDAQQQQQQQQQQGRQALRKKRKTSIPKPTNANNNTNTNYTIPPSVFKNDREKEEIKEKKKEIKVQDDEDEDEEDENSTESSSDYDKDSKEVESSRDSSSCSRKRKRCQNRTETETEDEPLSAKFRRGEPLPSDLDCLNLTNDSEEEEENDVEDEWMAKALEREFLDDENSQGSRSDF